MAWGNGSPRSLLPDLWIAAHPEHLLTYRRDEAKAAASARRRRALRRASIAEPILALRPARRYGLSEGFGDEPQGSLERLRPEQLTDLRPGAKPPG